MSSENTAASKRPIALLLPALGLLSCLLLMLWRPEEPSPTGAGTRAAVQGKETAPRAEAIPPVMGSPDASSPTPSPSPAPPSPTAPAALLVTQARTDLPAVRIWQVQPEATPASHWAPGTGGAAPQRSGRLNDLTALEKASAGDPIEIPLFDGLLAQGFVRRTVETDPGSRMWSGRLSSPQGRFFIERNRLGWHGVITLAGSDQAYRILPGTPGDEGPWLERWARTDIECAQSGSGGGDPDNPDVDPSLSPTNLRSRPGAARVIYLDFNGGTISNTYWNSEYNDDDSISYADCGMSNENRIRAWAHAAEEFSAFDVNVTTLASDFSNANPAQRLRVCITPTKSWYPGAKGGVARVGSWGGSSSVVWVWNLGWLSAGETIAHEAGHSLGLHHSSYYNVVEGDFDEYYHGHGEGATGWAPIMGYGADDARYLTHWDDGSYPFSTNSEDQKAVLTIWLGPLADDHGGSNANATTLPPEGGGPIFHGSGRLETSSDSDWFRLQLPAGTWAFLVQGNSFGKNIDFTIQVRNGLNEVVDEVNETHSPDATSAKLLDAGTYYLTVRSSTRAATDDDPGYDRYGQLGTYTVTVLPFGYEPTPPVATFVSINRFTLGSPGAEVQVRYYDETVVDPATLGNGDVKMQRSGSSAISGTLVSHSGDGHYRYATYYFSAPGVDWDIGEGGSYRIFVPANQIKDDWGNNNVETTLATYSLPATDPAPPAVTLPDGLGNASSGDTDYTFRIACSDIAPVQVSEYGKNCVEVRRVSASDGWVMMGPITPERIVASSSNYNKNWTVDYRMTAPGGVWDDTDLGEYEVWLRAGKVSDVNGNTAPSQKLGSFFLRKKLWEKTFDETGPVLVWDLDSGWATGAPHGTGGYRDDPTSAYQGNSILGYRLGSGENALYQNNLTTVRYATSPPIDVTGYQRLSLQFRRFLSIAGGDRAKIQVSRNGGSWTTIWQNEDTGVFDGSWKLQEIALPSVVADNASALRFRFSLGTTDADDNAGGWNLDNIRIIAAENYNPGRLILNNVLSKVTEGSIFSGVYTVRLDQAPAGNVTVTLEGGGQLVLSRSSLTFTPSNYSTPQSVTLSAFDDIIVEGNHFGVLSHKITSAPQDVAFQGVQDYRLIQVVDDDAPLISAQPEDKAVAPGQSAAFRVETFSSVGMTYQWYRGNRGDTSDPVSGATGALASIQLPAGSSQPVPVWVRVRLFTNRREDSQVAWLSPLTGYPAWKSRLRDHGYSSGDLEAAGFDDADPDRDGLGHFMEYAFGGQPYTRDEALLPRVSLQRSSGGDGGSIGLPGLPGLGQGRDLVLTLGPARADVRYITETSSNLQSWSVFKTTTATPLAGRLTPGDTVIRIPTHDAKELFARVRVEYSGP